MAGVCGRGDFYTHCAFIRIISLDRRTHAQGPYLWVAVPMTIQIPGLPSMPGFFNLDRASVPDVEKALSFSREENRSKCLVCDSRLQLGVINQAVVFSFSLG